MVDFTGQEDYVIFGDNLPIIAKFPGSAFQLIYIDPPFNTGKTQNRLTVRTVRSEQGDRTGFGGRRYSTVRLGQSAYSDVFDEYLDFIGPRLEEAKRLLTDDGTLYFHIDYRESHYCKVLLDQIFGRDNFLNEVIWAYDYGGRPRDRWPSKHDTILVYVKHRGRHYFNQDAIERIPYMAPGLVTAEKVARGKLPTDVWWQTIVPTNGREKTGYPTQKPEAVLSRLIQGSSQPGSWVLDFFAGSGTAGKVARQLGRRFVMIDNNPEAIRTMQRRLGKTQTEYLDNLGCPLPGSQADQPSRVEDAPAPNDSKTERIAQAILQL